MIKMRTGSLFDTDIDYIGHGVNTRGVMGAGVAKEIKSRFPFAYDDYVVACKSGQLVPGGHQIVYPPVPEDLNTSVIVNLATQNRPGKFARLEWIRSSLTGALRDMEGFDNWLAIPRIGCGRGGLKFPDVLEVIEQVLQDHPSRFTIEIWTLPGKH